MAPITPSKKRTWCKVHSSWGVVHSFLRYMLSWFCSFWFDVFSDTRPGWQWHSNWTWLQSILITKKESTPHWKILEQQLSERQVLESPSPVLLPTPLALRKWRKTSREINTSGETNPTLFMEPTPILDTQSSNQQEYVSSFTSDYSIAKFSYNSSQPVHHLSHKPVSWQDQISWTQLPNTMVRSNGVHIKGSW